MPRRTVARIEHGHRTICGTDWPVTTEVVRHQIVGRRPSWLVIHRLCNGAADRTHEYRTRQAALESIGLTVEDLL